jgi:hypothetical protein
VRDLLVGCCALLAGPLAAQQIPTMRVSAPDVVHSHEFTSITSVRELSDGRVLVTDGRERRLVVLDFATSAARDVGRTGRGPMEYENVGFIQQTTGDSSIMADLMARRWLVLHRDSIVQTIPPDHPAIVATRSLFNAADSRGFVARRVDPPLRDGVTIRTERDSSALVLYARATGRADTVARLRAAPRQLSQRTDAQGRIVESSTYSTQLLPSEEDFALFSDGAIAVARLNPFRIDWRLPDGRWIHGDSLPIPKIRVDARERRAFEARNPGPRWTPPAGFPQPPVAEFPDHVPPFPMGQGLVRGPRGVLFVRRTKSADFPDMTYLVIDRSGRLVGTFTLTSRERIEGASDRALYISERDEDDIIRLRRHRWR